MAPTLPNATPARTNAPIDGETQLLFMVGHPVHQVKAPQQLNPRFAARGLNAVMLPLEVGPEEFRSVVRALMEAANVHGFVFTVPHKFSAALLADELGAEARACSAINAMVRVRSGRWHGDMFDGRGFVAGLRDAGHAPEAARAMLVGAGGAGTAIAVALLAAGVASIDVFDVDASRTRTLLAHLSDALSGGRVRLADRPQAAPEHSLVVNATPLGMNAGDPLPIDLARLHPDAIVAEALMAVQPTPLLRLAAARGNPVVSGHRMLSGQMQALEDFLLRPLRPPSSF